MIVVIVLLLLVAVALMWYFLYPTNTAADCEYSDWTYGECEYAMCETEGTRTKSRTLVSGDAGTCTELTGTDTSGCTRGMEWNQQWSACVPKDGNNVCGAEGEKTKSTVNLDIHGMACETTISECNLTENCEEPCVYSDLEYSCVYGNCSDTIGPRVGRRTLLSGDLLKCRYDSDWDHDYQTTAVPGLSIGARGLIALRSMATTCVEPRVRPPEALLTDAQKRDIVFWTPIVSIPMDLF